MRTASDLSRKEESVLAALRSKIQEEFPDWPVRLTLFGSRARGEAEPDSDMDVLVEIDTDCISFSDKQSIRRLAGNISIDSGIVLSLLIVDRHTLEERGDFSIFQSIREEGLRL